jgi:LysM repeat protein
MGTALVALFSGGAVHADRLHVVKKGETLFGLSRKYDVSVSVIAEANDLTTKTKLKIGQKLNIPNATSDKPRLDASLKKTLDRTSIKRGRWKNIVIHHSATPVGNVKGMDEYHRKVRHMENGLAYHFVIGNGRGMPDGRIAAGERWSKQLPGGHLASEALNRVSLGVCLVGNFQKSSPTAAQIESLAALTNYLLSRCRLSTSSVETHQQINTVYTECPGRKFPVSKLKKLLV